MKANERLLRAIGAVDDEKLALADELKEQAQAKSRAESRTRRMPFWTPMAAGFAAIAVAAAAMLYFLAPGGEVADPEHPDTSANLAALSAMCRRAEAHHAELMAHVEDGRILAGSVVTARAISSWVSPTHADGVRFLDDGSTVGISIFYAFYTLEVLEVHSGAFRAGDIIEVDDIRYSSYEPAKLSEGGEYLLFIGTAFGHVTRNTHRESGERDFHLLISFCKVGECNCEPPDTPEFSFIGTVENRYGGLVVVGDDGSVFHLPDAPAVMSPFSSYLPPADFVIEIHVGDRIMVLYNGEIFYSYPGMFGGVSAIHLMSRDWAGYFAPPVPPVPDFGVIGNTPGNLISSGWTADYGGQVFFYSYNVVDEGIYSMNADGSNRRRIYTADGRFALRGMNIVGGRLFFASNGVRSMNLDGSDMRVLLDDAGVYALCVADDNIFFIRQVEVDDDYRHDIDRNFIYTMKTDGSGLTRLAAVDERCRDYLFAAGGRLYWRNGSMNPDGSDYRIYGRDSERYYAEICVLGEIGGRIYYLDLTVTDDEHYTHLYSMNIDGSDRRQVSDIEMWNNRDVHVTPDGVYFASRDLRYLRFMNLDGSGVRTLADGGYYAAISMMGGRLVVYHTTRANSSMFRHTMNLDGSNIRPLD
jgi:hypothetical protein